MPGNTAAEGATLADSAESSPTSDEDVSNRLEPLAWIVGKWAGGGAGDNRVEVSCAWTKNERFITRQFSVIDPSGDALLDGTQVIGWDPASETIRSWTFDSEGGFGEAAWSLDGDRWLIKSAFTLATGEKASALNVLTRLGDDTATWASVNREVDGQLQPNLPEIKVARVASESDMATSQEATE